MMQKIKYGNTSILYELIQSNRIKTSQITVTVQGVTVRTPKNKPIRDVKNMVRDKASWIYKKQLYYAGKKKTAFSTKSTLPVLDRHYTIKIIPSSAEHVRIEGNTLEFYIPQKRHTDIQIQKMYNAYLNRRARVLFIRLTKKLADTVGVDIPTVNIKQLKDRWGSSTGNEINLNYNLIKAPKFVVEYVILHELCHFRIKDHSYRFWRLVSSHMHDYQRAVTWLRDNGIMINYSDD